MENENLNAPAEETQTKEADSIANKNSEMVNNMQMVLINDRGICDALDGIADEIAISNTLKAIEIRLEHIPKLTTNQDVLEFLDKVIKQGENLFE